MENTKTVFDNAKLVLLNLNVWQTHDDNSDDYSRKLNSLMIKENEHMLPPIAKIVNAKKKDNAKNVKKNVNPRIMDKLVRSVLKKIF